MVYTIHSKQFQVFVCFSVWNEERICLKCSLPLPLPSQCQFYTFIYKQPVYKQLGLELRKVKKLLGLKHVTISNFANKIFAYENIATTLHNHISDNYTDFILFSDFIIMKILVKKMERKKKLCGLEMKEYFLIIFACELRVFYRHPLRNP